MSTVFFERLSIIFIGNKEMYAVIDKKKYQINYLQKILGNFSGLFVSKLLYWSEHENQYGIVHNNRVWIYNTMQSWAEQLNCSPKTIQRAVKFLREKGIIEQKHLSKNKRDRTLYYSLNYSKLSDVFCRGENVQIDDQMNNRSNKQNNKSYKSGTLKNSINDKKSCCVKQKPTIVQDMIKIWKENFPNSKLILTKQLAKYLVAAFKNKFNSRIDKWRKYISLIKTSKYICNNNFYLCINWVIKYFTIDRITNGDLGVNKNLITSYDHEQITEDNFKKALEHIDSVDEPEKFKILRKEIVKKISPEKYNSWFKHVSFIDKEGEIYMQLIKENSFLRDYITINFSNIIHLRFL